MRKGGTSRISRTSSLALSVIAAAVFLQVACGSALAVTNLVSGIYQLNWDQTVDKTADETKDVRKFKHSLELKFKGFLTPVVQNEITFKLEQETNSDAADITRYLPMLDLGFRGKFWDAKAGAKRSNEYSDDPTAPAKETDNYFVEIYYKAPKRLPDLKAKYTLDTDFQDTVTDTRKQGITVSSVYSPREWLEAKGDYIRNKNDDMLNADSDTEDEKSTGTLAIRHMLSEKIKIEVQGSSELTREAKIASDNGAALPDTAKEDQNHKVKSMLSFRPFATTSLDGSYDFELKQNKVNGEHTISQNYRGAASQKIGKPYDINVTFNRNTVDTRHSADDFVKTEDTVTIDAKGKVSKRFMVTLKYQSKDTDEEHVDPTKSVTSASVIRSATYTGEIASYWLAAASFDQTDTITDEVKTTVDKKYSVRSTFDFKALNLTLDPSYDISLNKDLLAPDSTAIRDFKFKLAWKTLPTRNTEAKVEHTYGRKTDSGAKNIERTDNSAGNLTWKEPLPGWIFSFDFTRTASDKSEDDQPPDITASYGVKGDFKLDRLSIGTSVKYDRKSLTDNNGTFDAKVGWIAPNWDTSLAYTFKKTFSEELNEGYTISLTFKYNL